MEPRPPITRGAAKEAEQQPLLQARPTFYFLFAASMQLAIQITAIVLATSIDSLSHAGLLTLSLALLAPVQLLAGMALNQLLLSGNIHFADVRLLLCARLFVAIPAFLAMLLGIAFWGDTQLFMIACATMVAKIAELLSEICIAQHRISNKVNRIAVSRIVLALFFFSFLALLLLAPVNQPPTISIVIAYASSYVAALLVDLYFIRSIFASPFAHTVCGILVFSWDNIGRGLANAINSFGTNLPRYFLQLLVSTEVQAAYSLLSSVSRLATRSVQPILFSTLIHLRTSLMNLELAWVNRYSWLLLGIAGVVGLSLVITWQLAYSFGYVTKFSTELAQTIGLGEGTSVLLATSAYFLRFLFWHLAMIGLNQRMQLRIAGFGIAASFLVGAAAIAMWGILGAAASEIVVNLAIVLLVLTLTKRSPPKAPTQGSSN